VLSAEQREIQALVRTLAEERIAPRAAEIDESHEFPWDIVDLFRESDLFALYVPELYGGTGTGALAALVAIEEVSKICASSGLILAVQSLGSLDLWQVAIKPGKPFAYGRIGAAHFMGLPGNPVSSFVTFLLLVRPFLLKLQGAAHLQPRTMQVPAHFSWPRADKRREFLRVRRNAEGGLALYPNQSSGVLTSAVWADGLVDNR
jgi:hypothetical protein